MDRKLRELQRRVEAGDTEATVALARETHRSVDVIALVSGLSQELQAAMAQAVLSERLIQAATDSLIQNLDLDEIASHVEIDAQDVADHIEVDASDVADNVDVSDVADNIDVSEVAEHIDLDDLADQVVAKLDLDDLAARVAAAMDPEEIASHIET